MSKRYGRNQKRKAKAEIVRLEAVAKEHYDARVKYGEQTRALEYKVQDWARRIVARLGHTSAFALDKYVQQWAGDGRFMAQTPVPFEPVSRRLERVADDLSADLVMMFVHHVEAEYKRDGGRDMRGQLVLHLSRGPSHEPLYIALSADQMDKIRYSKDPEYLEFLVRGLARQFARHAEELSRG